MVFIMIATMIHSTVSVIITINNTVRIAKISTISFINIAMMIVATTITRIGIGTMPTVTSLVYIPAILG